MKMTQRLGNGLQYTVVYS